MADTPREPQQLPNGRPGHPSASWTRPQPAISGSSRRLRQAEIDAEYSPELDKFRDRRKGDQADTSPFVESNKISESSMGRHSRPNCAVFATSGLAPIAAEERTFLFGRFVPEAAVSG
jgi:hypothetical protein